MPIDKTMMSHMRSDAWKQAQKKAAQQKSHPPMHAVAKKPGEFDPIAHTDKTPSGLKTSHEEGAGAGAVAGFQIPLGMQKRKESIDEVLRENPDIGEGVAMAYMSSLSEDDCEQVGNMLDMGDRQGVAEKMRMHAVRELVRSKVREVVRKKEGGGGYVLYAPNKGKKGKAKAGGTFPTKLGAKRAELARYPPKEPGKLTRLRKYVTRLTKKPSSDKAKRRESVIREAGGTPFSPQSPAGAVQPTQPTQMNQPRTIQSFSQGLQKLPKGSPDRTNFLIQHANDADFMKKLTAQSPDQAKMLTQIAFKAGDKSAMLKPGAAKTTVQGGGNVEMRPEHIDRRLDFMHRTLLSKVINRSLKESLFREESTESEWDDYISRLSKQALAGDSKFQSLQKNISRKTGDILDDAFVAIKKAVGKDARLKSFGPKHDPEGGTYLMFSAEFGDATVGPIAIAVEGGKPRIHLSPDAKAALMKVDPAEAKSFRAELITVQEAILDEMDDLERATQTRDKYLQKLETNVDAYVAGLSPLEISVLKNLLVKKYRKIS